VRAEWTSRWDRADPIVEAEGTMDHERDAGGVLATIGAWLGAAAMVVAALLVLPFTGGPRLPMSPRTAPVTVTTPTTPPTPPPVAVLQSFRSRVPVFAPPARVARDIPPAPRVIVEPPESTPGPATVCGPVEIAAADGPLGDPGTELELTGAGGITVLTDVGTLEGDGVSLVGCQ
jgi:hypothetical protein